MTEAEKMQKGFVHLHVHTGYSLLDSTCRIWDLLSRAQEYQMPALAITDHGTMAGVPEFYRVAKKCGINPIIGVEAYVAPRSLKDKEAGIDDCLSHLLLLAATNQGYHNLIKIVSSAALDDFYNQPRVDKKLLREYSSGIIALSGCMAGEIPQALLAGDYPKAEKLVQEYLAIFGPNNFYLEIQRQGLPEEAQVNPGLIRLSRETGVPLVATCDVHYIDQADAEAHDVLLCIQRGKTVSDPDRMRFPGDSFYFRSPEEMAQLFADLPQAIASTAEIAARCDVQISATGDNLPFYQVPAGMTPSSYLRHLCYQALPQRYPQPTAQVEKRLEYELSVIDQAGHAAYFLIVWDFIRYARENDIPIGPGRGSAPGSIVNYLLQITSVDPLRFNLLFERFLDPQHLNTLLIDIDICEKGREQVVDYVQQRYGADHVCQIATFGTMKARAAIKEVGRAMNIPYAEVNQLAKLVLEELNINLESARAKSQELSDMVKSRPEYAKLYELAQRLEGLPRHASVHAAGIVIAKDPLTDILPLHQVRGKTITTQYAWDTVEELGIIKIDFLGLRTLTVRQNACGLILANRNKLVRPDDIPLDDPEVFKLLSKGDTPGVFQLESAGIRRYLQQLQPDRIEDIIAIIALYRPDPLNRGMMRQFIDTKHRRCKLESIHPLVDSILRETYGVIVYQEQIMQLATTLAGLSMGDANFLRKAMAKKKQSSMEEKRLIFIQGAKNNGVPAAIAVKIFDLMCDYAEYGYNKSHAAAYASLAYQTAWLKAHYPVEFADAQLNSFLGDSEKINEIIAQLRQSGMEILPPDTGKYE